MAKNLIIVESPAKAKTIKKYLGKDFEVLATYGHVRDLIPKEGAVDPENGFAMVYETIERNSKHMDAIAKAFKNAEALYLATDPDREGEAISWHVMELLKKKRGNKDKPIYRVAFYEITKAAVNQAVSNPREISMDLVNAQQARRALDYLVGFKLSPLLWRKIRRGLSAGRVQSPALRLIVEREEAIERFEPQEYWTIEAQAQIDKHNFAAKLAEYKGEKIQQFTINNEKQAKSTEADLLKQANGKLLVSHVEKKQRKRHPTAPFITSTLQQEAARKLGFTAQRTMRVAQQLYEGIDTGDGSVGLITYMRTDSVNLAQDAIDELRALVSERYGKENLPKEPPTYKTKAKNAQEAHEAIRPTHPNFLPSKIQKKLSEEQYKLYNLIWKRTVACQMIHATIDTVAVDLTCGEGNRFRANGSTIANPGFMAVYLEGMDDSKASDDDEKLLPPLKEGDTVDLLDIQSNQHFTEPPPRFSEASLVKALEEHGIGRPSTYASIISTLQHREYVTLEKKRFHPSDVGRIVSRFLTNYFDKYVDYDFTAKLEDELDSIARGEAQWVPLLEKFWGPFKERIDHTQENVQRKDVTHQPLDEKCPECGKGLSIRLGRAGLFIGCDAYPDCSYTRNIGEDKGQTEDEVVADRKCPDCDSDLLIKTGRYGKFIGCSGYPKCKHIEPLEKPTDTGVKCPECKEGSIYKRKARSGKIFYSCERYPKCKYALWYEPVDEACPDCKWPILMIKITKRRGKEKVCPQKECKYALELEPPE